MIALGLSSKVFAGKWVEPDELVFANWKSGVDYNATITTNSNREFNVVIQFFGHAPSSLYYIETGGCGIDFINTSGYVYECSTDNNYTTKVVYYVGDNDWAEKYCNLPENSHSGLAYNDPCREENY